jgi:hypothetical protein
MQEVSVFEDEVWSEKPSSIFDGDVVQRSGRPIALRYLISRHWGWPKKASLLAVVALRKKHGNEDIEIQLEGPDADRQQIELIQDDPSILSALLVGLRSSSSTESRINDAIIDSVNLHFVRKGDQGGITDDGLTRGILRSVACRLGVSVDALRKATVFGQRTTDILISVDVTDLEDVP